MRSGKLWQNGGRFAGNANGSENDCRDNVLHKSIVGIMLVVHEEDGLRYFCLPLQFHDHKTNSFALIEICKQNHG